MKYFFMIIDYSIPLFMIFSYPGGRKSLMEISVSIPA